jgi:hypothetical protein
MATISVKRKPLKAETYTGFCPGRDCLKKTGSFWGLVDGDLVRTVGDGRERSPNIPSLDLSFFRGLLTGENGRSG